MCVCCSFNSCVPIMRIFFITIICYFKIKMGIHFDLTVALGALF